MSKALKRAAKRFKARYGPRSSADRRPRVVVVDAGWVKRVRKALDQ